MSPCMCHVARDKHNIVQSKTNCIPLPESWQEATIRLLDKACDIETRGLPARVGLHSAKFIHQKTRGATSGKILRGKNRGR